MKIGLYLENKYIKSADLTNPEMGNPGVGGTQFLISSLPYYFKKYFPDKFDFVLYANSTEKLPEGTKKYPVKDISDAAKRAERQNCDILIWRPTTNVEGMNYIKDMDSYSIDIIGWAHNTPNINALNMLAKNNRLKRFVCVSQEQLDRLRDHPIFYKSTCIFNGFDTKYFVPKGDIEKKEKIITYVGSLIPAKGFHILARVWSKIEKKIPDVKLYVIGSGRLYNRNQSLGSWGIAEENYEKTFRKYLSDNKGNIKKNVYFLGLLTHKEKIDVMQKSNIGVVNPSGDTENCPGSALEFQAAKTPVVSIAKRGLLDTVNNKKTGLLGKNDRDLVKNIIYLINNPDIAKKYSENGVKFIQTKFSYGNICCKWQDLFNQVYDNIPHQPKPITQNPFHQYKIIREFLRYLKKTYPFLNLIPSLNSIIGDL